MRLITMIREEGYERFIFNLCPKSSSYLSSEPFVLSVAACEAVIGLTMRRPNEINDDTINSGADAACRQVNLRLLRQKPSI